MTSASPSRTLGRKRWIASWGLGLWFLAPFAPAASPPPSSAPSFQDVTAAAGIVFEHHHAPEKKYILESVSGGVALLDYDQDGKLDIYLVGSQTVATARQGQVAHSALYRNESTTERLKFTDVTRQVRANPQAWGVGACVADVDQNGFPDLYVTGVGRNWLFMNRNGKAFDEAAEQYGVQGGGWSTGCAFADFDRDGDLDLFVARYLSMNLENLPEFGRGELCKYRGIPVQCGPRGLEGQKDLFFRNEGNGRFSEVGSRAGLDDKAKMFGLGASWLDVDGDGWQDLFVANDTMQNYLYINQKNGTFEEMSHLYGVAVSEDGKEQGSMGIAIGDYDRSGWPSLFVTNFSEEYNAFYRNQKGQYFTDASFATKTAAASVRHVGWGTTFADIDNDGWQDLVLVNGHVYPQIDQIDLEASAPYHQRRMLFKNRGDGSFDEVTFEHGPFAEERVSRGLAAGDLDGDGRLDLVINNLDGKAQILRNETPTVGHWLDVKLHADKEPVIGAQITIRTSEGDQTIEQTRTVRSGTSYLSQDAMSQHFGLGNAERIQAIEVRWPDGTLTTHPGVAANQRIVLRRKDSKPH